MSPHYKTLGVSPSATTLQLRAAHRTLAAEFHPDRNPAGAGRMAEVNAAYAVLSDPNERRLYDLAHGLNGPCKVCGGTGKLVGVIKFKRVVKECVECK